VLICIIAIILGFTFPKAKVFDKIHQIWGASLFWLLQIPVQPLHIQLPGPGPYIIMANHQSNLDPPLLLWKIHLKLRFITKIELFWIPLFGLAMWAAGHVPIQRSNHQKAVISLAKAAQKICEGTSILVFPEGTRSPNPNELLPFKKGGFMLAIQSQMPILPIGIVGTGDCLPKHTWQIQPKPIQLCIGTPILTQGLKPEDRDTLMEKVRQQIRELRNQASNAMITKDIEHV